MFYLLFVLLKLVPANITQNGRPIQSINQSIIIIILACRPSLWRALITCYFLFWFWTLALCLTLCLPFHVLCAIFVDSLLMPQIPLCAWLASDIQVVSQCSFSLHRCSCAVLFFALHIAGISASSVRPFLFCARMNRMVYQQAWSDTGNGLAHSVPFEVAWVLRLHSYLVFHYRALFLLLSLASSRCDVGGVKFSCCCSSL